MLGMLREQQGDQWGWSGTSKSFRGQEGQRSGGGKIVKGSVGQSKDLGLDSE